MAQDTTAVMALLQSRGWVPASPPSRMRDIDLPRIGHKIGVGEDPIHAVLDVEAPHGGYDSKGRLTILYEPHVAYRCSSGAVRAALVAAGLAYSSWGQQPYGDSYAKFTAAYRISPETACRAVSQGRGQLLGENFVVCGYKSAVEMYATLAARGEVEHLEAMVRFIKGNHLDDELRALNWAGFARGYNGPQYAKNKYDVKLKARYEWWAKRPDTPWSPDYVIAENAGEPIHVPPSVPVPVVVAPAPAPAAEPKPPLVASEYPTGLGIRYNSATRTISWNPGRASYFSAEGLLMPLDVDGGTVTGTYPAGFTIAWRPLDRSLSVLAGIVTDLPAGYRVLATYDNSYAGLVVNYGMVEASTTRLPPPVAPIPAAPISETESQAITGPAVQLPVRKKGLLASVGRWIDDIFYRD